MIYYDPGLGPRTLASGPGPRAIGIAMVIAIRITEAIGIAKFVSDRYR